MRFTQLLEGPSVSAQDFYNAAVIKWGRHSLKRMDYKIYKKSMADIKAMFPGMRVLPKEIRASEDASMYDMKKAGVNLAAPGVPQNPYDGDDSKFKEFREFAAPLVDAFTKGKRDFSTVTAPAQPTTTPKTFIPAAPILKTTKEVVEAIKVQIAAELRVRLYDLELYDDEIGVRHWGNWEVPEGEEDDGDYDWEVMTPQSEAKLKEIMIKLNASMPKGWKLTYSVGEKNWIYFHIKKA